jgi:stage II sporulation protein AA (anti-sigma F factor antagonist)
MQIHQERAGAAVVIAANGRLDSLSAPQLRSTLDQLDAANERRIVVDMARVDYISSAGLATLFGLAKRMRDVGGSLALCALSDQVRRVFELAGYTQHFTLTATRDEAVASVGGRPA